MTSEVALPGMVAAASGARLVTLRGGTNVWWVALTDACEAVHDVLAGLGATSMPSDAISTLEAALGEGIRAAAVVAKLELDVCGAWLTVANACAGRPVVVRRAGWVDLRGHPGAVLGAGSRYEPSDDRVGLGPADVLVLHLSEGEAPDEVVDACLGSAGASAPVVVETVGEATGAPAVAIGVPEHLGSEPLVRVAEAIGATVDEVQTPGYPFGDLQPDLWKRPPRPPRLARLRLSTDRSGVAGVRSLLDRLLASWRLDGRLDSDDVKLVATELAANAVVHTGAPETVTVRYLGDVVRIEVNDRGPHEPVPRTADPDALDGRGMQLIEALGTAWGTESLAEGKRVWCELAVAPEGDLRELSG